MTCLQETSADVHCLLRANDVEQGHAAIEAKLEFVSVVG
jgi:thioester reductase-like protein